jgi:tRNA pseudouridine38-40 synthase
MPNFRLEIEYEGTNYCGWQVQPHRRLKSIQQVIEEVLRKILQEKVKLVASGRTDAGVHALAQVANFKTNSQISLDKLQHGLNSLLPPDIVIKAIEEVPADFHSRFQAKSKVYRYVVLNRAYPSALLRNTVYQYPYPLDLQLMRKEAKALLGKHDFKSFCATAGSTKTTIRTIKHIRIYHEPRTMNYEPKTQPSDCLIYIEIEADGFLYNMVRNIVGTLLEIGRGKMPAGSLKKILLAKDRKLAGPTAPAQGLCLLRVKY